MSMFLYIITTAVNLHGRLRLQSLHAKQSIKLMVANSEIFYPPVSRWHKQVQLYPHHEKIELKLRQGHCDFASAHVFMINGVHKTAKDRAYQIEHHLQHFLS